MRASYLLVLMILYAAANILAVMNGVDEMTQLNKLTGLLSCGVLFVYYFTLGLWYMLTKRNVKYSE